MVTELTHETQGKYLQVNLAKTQIRFTALRAKLSSSHVLKLGSQRLNNELLSEENLGRITLNTLKMGGDIYIKEVIKILHTSTYIHISNNKS